MISELPSGTPSPAQRGAAGGSGSVPPTPTPSPLRPRRFATCRSAGPDSTTLGGLPAQSSPGKGITPLVPLLEPPRGGGGSGCRGSCPPDSPPWQSCPTPGCMAPRGFRAQGHHLFSPSGLVCARLSYLPPPRPSPLPPHVGTAPLGQAFFLSSSSSCLEKAPIVFLSFHLRDILITSLLQSWDALPGLLVFLSLEYQAPAQSCPLRKILFFAVQGLRAERRQ